MILGIGTDLVEVERIRASVERFGDRFLTRVFTPDEQRYCAGKRRPEQNLAARFAAKEAAAKALGTGISRGVSWKELEVTRERGRAPQMRLRGRAAMLAAELGVRRVALTMTHTDAHANAVVILEGDG